MVLSVSPALGSAALNALFAVAWPDPSERDWESILSRSLACVGAFQEDLLVGFVNLTWDGGIHAFLLDTTVHPAVQRRGVGTRIVRAATEVARERGMEGWTSTTSRTWSPSTVRVAS